MTFKKRRYVLGNGPNIVLANRSELEKVLYSSDSRYLIAHNMNSDPKRTSRYDDECGLLRGREYDEVSWRRDTMTEKPGPNKKTQYATLDLQ